MFNYFGRPNPDTGNCSLTYEEFKKLQLNLSQPVSSWQRLQDDLFVYSSYVLKNQKIHTISYGKLKNLDLECHIFFRNKINSVPGDFSYNKIANSSDTPSHFAYRGYILTCDFSENETPIGVSYREKGKPADSYSPIIPVKIQPESLTYNGSALCVAPPTSIPMLPADMVSFLNFHDLVGMNHFVIYDYGVPNYFHEALRSMIDRSGPYWKLTYEVVPWNFPYADIAHNAMRSVVEADCLYRVYNKVTYASTVTWEEYLVLKFHHLVSELLLEFKKSRTNVHRFSIKTQTFCTQQADDKRSRATNLTPVVLRKTNTTLNEMDVNHIFIYKPHEAMRLGRILTHRASPELIVVNRYLQCADYNPESNKYDGAILRFAGDMKNSPILRRFTAGKLFDN